MPNKIYTFPNATLSDMKTFKQAPRINPTQEKMKTNETTTNDIYRTIAK